MNENTKPDEHWWGDAAPVLVGWLNDAPPALGNEPVVKFAVDRFNSGHRLDRKIEVLSRRAQGAPAGRILNIFETFDELCDAGCLAVMGPTISDACIELQPRIQQSRVPVISSGASADVVGEWCFGVQWGSIPEEGYLIANWLVREGHRRVAVTWDTAYHAGEYLRHFRAAARRANIDIVGERRITQLFTDRAFDQANEAIRCLKDTKAEALVHLGTGYSALTVATAVRDSGWDIARIANDSFYMSAMPEVAPQFEGWVGIAGWDEDNPIFVAALRDYESQEGAPAQHPETFAVWYTLTTAVCEGVALAPILSRDGVRRGLEGVTMLPCAVGGARTVVSWSPWNHRGIKGADAYILRRITDGKSVLEMRFDPTLAHRPAPR